MFKDSAVIKSVKGRHSFACFDLQFVDPTSGQFTDIPGGVLHMVQRGSGVRSALYYRLENVTFDHTKHDDSVVRDILVSFLKELYSADGVLGDFLPLCGPHDKALINPTPDAEEKVFWSLSQYLWNHVTSERHRTSVSLTVDEYSGTRLTCSFGNGLAFVMSKNKRDLYRRPDRLTGKVRFCGDTYHFTFFHSELSGENLESMVKPDQCVQLMMGHLDQYAPLLRGLEMELKFAD
jgi:hypothetical protein